MFKIATSICLLMLINASSTSGQSVHPRKKVQSLALKISVDESNYCPKSELKLTLRLTNRSKKPVSINTSKPWQTITFSSLFIPTPDRAGLTHVFSIGHMPSSHIIDKFVELKPGDSYKTIELIKLDDKIFMESGKLTIKATYMDTLEASKGIPLFVDTIESNNISINIVECGKINN